MTSFAQVSIQEPLFRVMAILRYALAGLTFALNLGRVDEALRPLPLVIASILILVLAVIAHQLYAGPHSRRGVVLGADFGVTLLMCMISPALLGPGEVVPLTGLWGASAPMTIAIARGWLPGGCAAFALCLVATLQHKQWDLDVIAVHVGLVVGAAGLGAVVDELRRVTAEQERLHAHAALISERQRLSRIVHDGVLQVLAMVEREGPRLGPRGVRLAQLAHEQEGQLRALIQDADPDPESTDPRDATHRNLAITLDRYATGTVTVSAPAEPLLIDSARCAELDAAIGEALTNVSKHAGSGARAWVLLEADGEDAVVSIRDNGVGGDPAEFAAAMNSGRLGMKHSIYGRIHDLGGTVGLRTAPGRGVEWEFRVPIEPR